MKYQKPELIQAGAAITAIEAGFSKDQNRIEGQLPSVDAYEADE